MQAAIEGALRIDIGGARSCATTTSTRTERQSHQNTPRNPATNDKWITTREPASPPTISIHRTGHKRSNVNRVKSWSRRRLICLSFPLLRRSGQEDRLSLSSLRRCFDVARDLHMARAARSRRSTGRPRTCRRRWRAEAAQNPILPFQAGKLSAPAHLAKAAVAAGDAPSSVQSESAVKHL